MTTADHRGSRSSRLLIALLLVALLIAGLSAWLLRPDDSGRPFAMDSPRLEQLSVPRPASCGNPATAPFTPTTVTIPHVVKAADVLALARDAHNVPGVPPTSARFTFAWDRPPGIKPGADRGNVLLNAHTWPDGSAVGNVLLAKLHEGDRIVLRGDGSELCYTVSKRVEVLASKGYPAYYDREGTPKIALIVCSGKRLGPGAWTHRTIWFADPA